MSPYCLSWYHKRPSLSRIFGIFASGCRKLLYPLYPYLIIKQKYYFVYAICYCIIYFFFMSTHGWNAQQVDCWALTSFVFLDNGKKHGWLHYLWLKFGLTYDNHNYDQQTKTNRRPWGTYSVCFWSSNSTGRAYCIMGVSC